ncbi:GntR family transcriptional regulator [Gracilibacillus caseinilyticus]|uniref:GntR family transcriptional regulator n=1 Tax=Gracilibacillus caseinilyticus TaxID=2932256 RepID=A0ABY4F3L4_9BACI|nr:GntR family transcriptional regulator [Gracilibacillus caseinilyticus]UOQ49046.1 GntR family transcriptional regulator [Gracilibacillus caseinilyticus]
MEGNSLLEDAYQIIRKKILTCALPPGSLLSIYKLAEELEMSRTPISNAIARLEREGLVTPLKNRGVLVKQHSPRELIEMFQINYSYQLFVLHVVERKGHQSFDLEELRKIVEEQQQAKTEQDYITYVQLSLKFIRTFISTIENEAILAHVDANSDKIMISSVAAYHAYPNKRIYSGLSYNQKMLEALENNDFDQARLHADQYFDKVKERIILKV